jgi:uncharacterized membrane protein
MNQDLSKYIISINSAGITRYVNTTQSVGRNFHHALGVFAVLFITLWIFQSFSNDAFFVSGETSGGQ